MKWFKLTAITSILFSVLLSQSSCEKDGDKKVQRDYSKTGIVMSGAQETPGNPSAATGSMDVFYSKETRILSYTVSWSGLTDSVMLMHIHGRAPAGFSTGVFQNIIVPSTPNGSVGNGIFPQKTSSGKYNFSKSGKISATLLIDGVAIKEEDLLNGLYYMNIHTPVYPSGEIRGQITFQ